MERFLQYSLERRRAIRLIFMTEDGSMKQVSAVVDALTEGNAAFTTLRPKRQYDVPLEAILSADYRRGDEGQE